MKITELIKELETIAEEHGDLDVLVLNEDFLADQDYPPELSVEYVDNLEGILYIS